MVPASAPRGQATTHDKDGLAERLLIGQVPLEILDWVVDPSGQHVIGNPEHGGEQIIEVF